MIDLADLSRDGKEPHPIDFAALRAAVREQPQTEGMGDVEVAALPLETIQAKLVPVMEFRGVEYRLTDESARRFALALQSTARAAASAQEPADADDIPQIARKKIGGEDRIQVSTPSATPYKWIGVYGTTTRPGATVFKACNRYTGMTSAHAFHTGSAWKSPQNIRFSMSSASPPANGWVGTSCYTRSVPSGWNGSDRAYDFATIGFRGNGASCTLSTYDVGFFTGQTVGSGVTGITGTVAGYPDKLSPNPPPGAWVAPEMFQHTDGSGYTSSAGAYPTQLWYLNDTTDGQSGAPYFTNVGGTVRVRGIHWGYDLGVFQDTNAARRWDATLDTWCSTAGGF